MERRDQTVAESGGLVLSQQTQITPLRVPLAIPMSRALWQRSLDCEDYALAFGHCEMRLL